MIKDVFTLDKNAWHAQLMKWIWGFTHRDFSHICPYFWLTLLNVIIFIPYGIFKLIGIGFVKITNKVDRYFEESDKKKTNEFWDKLKSDEQFRNNFIKSDPIRWRKFMRRVYNAYLAYSDSTFLDDLEHQRYIFQREADKRKDKEGEYYRKMAKEINNKERINKILKIVKPVLRILGVIALIAVGIFICYLLYLLGIWLSSIKHVAWLSFFTLIKRIIIIAAGIIAARWLASFLHERNVAGDLFSKRVNQVFHILGWPFRKLRLCIAFIYGLIKDSCPAIDWK